ncbi:MAG: hypothetical protein ACREB5_09660, partial [Sphingomonadaceae bacterium]
MPDGPNLDPLLRRDRWIILAGLALLCALAWAFLLTGAGTGMDARDMAHLALTPTAHDGGMMDHMGMAGMSEPSAWGPAKWVLAIAMW